MILYCPMKKETTISPILGTAQDGRTEEKEIFLPCIGIKCAWWIKKYYKSYYDGAEHTNVKEDCAIKIIAMKGGNQ